jgi:predicted dehydrogenase
MTAHLPGLRHLAGFEVTAVATSRQESAEEAARKFGVPFAFDDAAKLVAHADVDLVVVNVRVTAHDQLVRQALEAGKHVFCEWPLGVTTDEARELAVLARQTGVRHVIGLQAYGSFGARQVAAIVREGRIGELQAVHLVGTSGVGGAADDPGERLHRGRRERR